MNLIETLLEMYKGIKSGGHNSIENMRKDFKKFWNVRGGGSNGRDRMVVGFRTTCAISAYHHQSWEFKPCSWRDVLDTTLCDKFYQWLTTGLWFYSGTLVSFTNKTDRHNIADLLLKVALNTLTLTPQLL